MRRLPLERKGVQTARSVECVCITGRDNVREEDHGDDGWEDRDVEPDHGDDAIRDSRVLVSSGSCFLWKGGDTWLRSKGARTREMRCCSCLRRRQV